VTGAPTPQRNGRQLAIRWLGQAPLTRFELERRLTRAGVEDAAAIVADLAAAGWQSDEAVAELELRRACRRHDGPQRLGQRLRQRGVDPELATRTVHALDDDTWWAQAWREAARTPHDEANRGRLARRLARRGFSSSVIAQVLERWGQEASQVDEEDLDR